MSELITAATRLLQHMDVNAESSLRGAVFLIRDDKGAVVDSTLSLVEAKRLTRKKGWHYEIVWNALTDEAIAILEG